MPITTTSDLNSLFNQLYEEALMTLREENVLVSNALVTQYSGTGFATRNVGQYASAEVQTKPEGVDFSNAQKFTKSSAATFSPQFRMAQFLLTDEMISTDDVDNNRDRARMELAAAIADQVDEDIVDLFTSFSSSKGTANTSLALGHVGAAVAKLRQSKIRGTTTVCLHPYQWHDIWTALAQPATQYAFLGEAATEALRRYFVSNLNGCIWVTNGNIDVDSSDDAYGAVFGREAIAYDEREAYGVEPERDASRKAWELNASLGYAVGILRNAAGVKILSDATEPTS